MADSGQTAGMGDEIPARIRWQPKQGITTGWAGYAGTLASEMFRVFGPNSHSGQYMLTTLLPGMEDRISHGAEAEVKAAAEEWLAEFAASLGAVFPSESLSAQLGADACTPACWTPVNCPTCGNGLPPRGRAMPLGMPVNGCCDKVRHNPRVNPRHLWNEEEASA